MTEQEWLECTDSMPMLEFLWGRVSDRKLRLFASAFCGGVDVVERYADGNAAIEELGDAAVEEAKGVPFPMRSWETAKNAACARRLTETYCRCVVSLVMEGYGYLGTVPEHEWFQGQEGKYNIGLVRCISGNPFRPVSLNPAWLEWNDGTVRKNAQAIYANRTRLLGDFVPARLTAWLNDPGSIRQWGQPTGVLDPVRLAVLADALDDAGCDNADILSHCRSDGPHVRGCWIVDLLLGKE